MLGRPGESARVAAEGLAAVRRYGADATVLVANQVEALLAVGDWDEAERASVTALRTLTASYSYMALIIRADVEIGRGHFDAARAHLEAARATLREDRGLGVYDGYRAELALWERRWADAAQAIDDGLTQAQPDEAAQIRVQLCAKGLRAQAELAALARARRDEGALRARLDRARELLTAARRAAAEAAPINPNAAAWHLQARAEHTRTGGPARPAGADAPRAWADAAAAWDRLERPPLAAYCRWRLAEALLAAGASRAEASVPLRGAHAVAARIGARPLAAELELLAQRARLDLAPPEASAPGTKRALEEALGLTPREADVLALMARGYTNREIATTLVISVKTAGVHVSHILRKLDAPNRLEAAAIAHRLAPGPGS
jgi:DNA-binding CsgD family transcriptional regulator